MRLLYAITNNHKNVKHFVFVSLPSVFVFKEIFIQLNGIFFERTLRFSSLPFLSILLKFKAICTEYLNFLCLILNFGVFFLIERVHLPTLSDWLFSGWLLEHRKINSIHTTTANKTEIHSSFCLRMNRTLGSNLHSSVNIPTK